MLSGLSVIPALFAALILRTDRRLVASLRTLGALSPATAQSLEVPQALTRWRLARLQNVGAVGRNQDGNLFLDSEGWTAYRSRRRIRLMYLLAVLLGLVLIVGACSMTGGKR
jgi:hypothetical protein